MKRTLPLLLLLLLLLPGLSAFGQDAETKVRFAELVKEFKQVRKSAVWEQIKVRRDLINQLADLDHPGVVDVLYAAFKEDREQVCRIPAMIGVGKHGGYGALKAMTTTAVRDRNDVYIMCLPLAFEHADDEKIGPWLVKSLLKKRKPPPIRPAVIESLGLLRTPEAFEPLLAILEKESRDLRTAYESLIALARIDGARAAPVVLPFLEHEERVLRAGAVTALTEIDDPALLEEIVMLAGDACPRVQEAVVFAILARKSEEHLPVLIDLLRTKRLRVMDTARIALEEITGEEFGLDADAWTHWLKEKNAGRAVEKDPNAPPSSVVTYYGMNVLSDRVLFIVDVSGSMKAGKPPRLETAQAELKKTLGQLNERTLVNIVVFSGTPVWWRDSEVKATKQNVADAIEFVEDLGAGGGTNIYDTFEEAFEKNAHVDTIFFLGDGSPSLGTYTEQEEILARLRHMNRFRKVRIHTIALIRGEVGRFGGRQGPVMGRGISRSGARAYDEEEAARFMARIASEHGGSFVKIEK